MILTGAFASPRPNPDTNGHQASVMIDRFPWCGTRGCTCGSRAALALLQTAHAHQGTDGLGLHPSCLNRKDLRSCASSSYMLVMPVVPSVQA